jgi:hypothetical protein
MSNDIKTSNPVAEDQAGSVKLGLKHCSQCHRNLPLEMFPQNSAPSAVKRNCTRNFTRDRSALTVYPAGVKVATLSKSRPTRKQGHSAVKGLKKV